MATSTPPKDYKDPLYARLADSIEQKLELPTGLLSSIITHGERSNADAVSSAGARTVAQIIPSTRDAAIKKYGIDAYLSPENALEVAGNLLKDSLDRNNGNVEKSVREYHGGTDPANWGPVNNAYWGRVSQGLQAAKTSALGKGFAEWMAANPAVPSAAAGTTMPAPQAALAPAKTALSAGFGQWLQAQQGPQGAAQIPTEPGANTTPTLQPEPSLADRVIGAGEAGLNTLTSLTGGALGLAGGTVKGLAGAIMDGTYGTPQGVQQVQQAATSGAQALTYEPRTQQGQEQAAAIGNLMQQAIPVAAVAHTLPPVMSGAPKSMPQQVISRAATEGVARDVADLAAKPAELLGVAKPGAAGDAAAGAVTAGTDVATAAATSAAAKAKSLSETATTLPRRAMERITQSDATAPTLGTRGSAGAAGTDVALQRRATANQLPVPLGDMLTKGMLSRDPDQLKFEVETSKIPDIGKPLRDARIAINDKLLSNFDAAIDQTGAQTTSLRAVGAAVDKALVDKYTRAKNEVNVKYRAAANSPEALQVVDPNTPVSIGAGENAITSSPIDFLNANPTGLQTTGLLDHARQYAIKIGIATVDKQGQLVGNPATTVKQMEAWRKEISQATGYEPIDIRNATILKSMIDHQTEPVAGPLYRIARNARRRLSQEFEDVGVIHKLLTNKRGTLDRQVALEDVFQHAILKGSLDDVRTVRKVLQTAGEDGQQAWRELQGATLRDILDKSTKSSNLDSAGNRVLSADALDKAIKALDEDGKLDFIFTKSGAQTLRDVREIAQIAKTVPPEAAINYSNTASALLAGFADLLTFATGGTPVATVARITISSTLKHIKDAKLKARVEAALGKK